MDIWQRSAIPMPTRPWDSSASADGVRDQLGRVRVARQVLRTVAREAALSVPGVAYLANTASSWADLLGRPRPRGGVAVIARADGIGVDMYLVVESGMNMVTVGEAVQEGVGTAIEHILGMRVREINVYIRDVS